MRGDGAGRARASIHAARADKEICWISFLTDPPGACNQAPLPIRHAALPAERLLLAKECASPPLPGQEQASLFFAGILVFMALHANAQPELAVAKYPTARLM